MRYTITKELDDSALIAHSFMNFDVEDDRQNSPWSIQYVEEARNSSFETSKAWSVIFQLSAEQAIRKGDVYKTNPYSMNLDDTPPQFFYTEQGQLKKNRSSEG